MAVVLGMLASLLTVSSNSDSQPGSHSQPALRPTGLPHNDLAVSSVPIQPATFINTVAGNGTEGYSGDTGPGHLAEMSTPVGDAVDAHGNLAVGDYTNWRIRMVAGTSGDWFGIAMTAGDIYTIAGDGTAGYGGDLGPAISAELRGAQFVAFDANGNLVMSDEGNNRVRVVAASSGTFYGISMTADDIYTVAGNGSYGDSGNGGPAVSAELAEPEGVALDQAGNIVFSDTSNVEVRVVAENTGTYYGVSMIKGDIYRIAGDGTSGYSGNGVLATGAELDDVLGVAIDNDGNAVLADATVVRVVAGPGCSSGCPYGLSSMTAGYIYTIAGTPGTSGYSGDGGPATSATFQGPFGDAVDAAGNVVVADSGNRAVRLVAESTGTYYGISMTAGDIYTIAGNGYWGYSGDGGPAASAEFDEPDGVATDPLGQVYVSDWENNVVRVFGGGPEGPQPVVPQGIALGLDQAGGGGPQPQCTCATASPVNIATGDYYDSVVDLTIPGAGIPLQFTRTYDASAARAEVLAGAAAPPLGYGWADNLAMTVSYVSGVATVTEANGALITFNHYGMGAPNEPAWCPSDTTTAVFCPAAPRYIASLSETGSSFTYTDNLASPVTYTFSTSGALSEIADASGDTLIASTYSPGSGQPSCPSGDTCTAWASSASGESLVVETNTSTGTLLSVFDPAATTQTVSFTYSGTGCSTWGSGQPVDLCSATEPGSLETTYTYDTGKSSPYQYDELAMTPPSTGAVANTYNTSGQVTEQVLGTGSGVRQVTDFSYASDPVLGTGGTSTTVTFYPRGTGSGRPTEVTQYQFSNEVLVAETSGYGTSYAATTYYERDPATLLATMTVDGDGNISDEALSDYGSPGGSESSSADATGSSDAVGNTAQYAYTSANLVWCSVDAAETLDGVVCPSTGPPSAPPTPGTDVGITITVYNSADEATSVTDPLGHTTTYSYTTSGYGVPAALVYCSVDPVEYKAGGVSCPTTYTTSHTADTTSSTYDSYGDVTGTTDADDDTTTYSYGVAGHPGLASSETDPDGTTTSFTYNATGEVLTKIVSFTGSSYSAETLDSYDTAGHLICVIAPYEYSKGVTTCPSSPPTPPTPSSDSWLGRTITTYDQFGRVVQVTNPVGGIAYTAYDQSGEVYCTVAPYEAANPADVVCPSLPVTTPTPASDLYLGATITTYDADGRVVQVTNPLGGITLTTYDPAGNLASTTVESTSTPPAPPNIVTAYTYDGDNRVVTTSVGSSAPVATTADSYDPDGNLYCSVSANAYAAGTYQCPPWQAGWIATPPSPTGTTPLYSATPSAGQANNVTTTFYNADSEQTETTDPDVDTSISAFDADGRTTCTSDPVNVAAWLTAHTSGTYPYLCPTSPLTTPPSVGSDPGYLTTIYDPAGRTTSATDQIGDTTSYTYDPAGNTLTTVDPRGETTTDCYYYEDGTGACAHSAPTGGGSADDLYSQTTPATTADPSGETTTHTYYPGEGAEATTTPAGTTTDSYDALSDLTSVTYSSAASGYSAATGVTYTYFPDGSRETMTDGTGTTTYGYDAGGDLTSQAFAAPTGSGLASSTLGHTYFATGVLASVVYPTYAGHANPTATYTYDAYGNMASVTDWLSNEVTFSSDLDGNETSQDNAFVPVTHPKGTSSTVFNYDNADLSTDAVSSLSCTGGNTLTQAFSGTFSGATGSLNADGQVTQDEESYASTCSGISSYERNYSYDLAGSVDYQGSVAQGSSADNFSNDPSGGNTNDESAGPTEISSHDSSGNFDTYDQVFDAAGEVTSQTPVAGSSGVSSTYAYDTLGDLASSTSGSSATPYSYNQLGQLVGVAPAPSSVTGYQYTGDGLDAASLGWSAASNVDGTNTLQSVSCPTTTFCAAVDNVGDVLTYDGTSWTAADNIDGTHPIESVSCPTASFCAAVDNDGKVTTYNGTSWSALTTEDGSNLMGSVSCVSSSFCVAVDNPGNVLVYNGSWTKTSGVDPNGLDSVSCASSTSCAAVDKSGDVVTYNGTIWSTPTSIDGTSHIESVSCPSSSFCAAVDNSGNVITTTNDWSSHTTASIDGTNLIESIDCTSSSFCTAVDVDGNEIAFNGAKWAPPENIDGTNTLRGTSCTSASYCVATDNKGNFLTFSGSSMIWDTAGSLPLVASDSTNDYIYGPSAEPVEQVNVTASPPTSNPVFMTYEPSDSSWLITSTSGAQVAFYRYDAYGNLAVGTAGSPFGYAVQYAGASPNSGLDNMRARWYDAQTGGFTSRDPLFSETDQAYAYAGGDPVNGGDPSGDIAAPAQSGDMCLPNPATGTYGSDVCIGQVGMAACVDAVGASYAVNLPGGVNLATEMCSGAFDGVAPGASWSNLVESYDPAYGMLYWAHQAWDVAQDPCSSNWTILEDSLNAFNSADATLLFGLGGADAGGFPDGGPSSLGDTGSFGVPARTPWGWTGTQSYRAAVKLVNQGGDLPDVYGAIPTQAQAEQLINGGGGSVTRIEEGHLEGGNPHSYPHINYRTSTGVRSSLQIITVTQAYP